MVKVFVYSTSMMQKSRYNQYYLGGKPFLGTGTVAGYQRYCLGGLDGIVPEEGKTVQGEVYELDEKAVAKLDFFHNTDSAFTRQVVEVQLENGEKLPVETYIWNGSVA